MLLGQLLVLAITTGKKSSSRLSAGLCCCKKIMACSLRYWNTMILFLGRYLIGVLECHQLINLESFITTWKKKVLVVSLAGCAVGSVIGSGDYDRKKKVPVVCLAGRRLLLWPEKKKFLSSVWRVRDRYYDRKKKNYTVVCLVGARYCVSLS